MFNIKYEIGLNEHKRPCIELPLDYEQRPEDRFFVIEVTRYILQDLLRRRTEKLDERTIIALRDAEALLGQLGDESAKILYGNMRTLGDVTILMDSAYHMEVNGIEERDNLPETDIIYEDKIFDREVGLRVYVKYPLENYDMEKAGAYELVDGITNEHWKKG